MKRFIPIVLFAIAFSFVESSVVVYLRSIYYPAGFNFPLSMIQPGHVWVELIRELATIIMLAAAGFLGGTSRWQRFAFFLIAFGVWDIFYYGWLKVILDWPSTLLDWDILFLIPVPWIGPVIAPLIISLLFLVAGSLLLRWEAERGPFQAPAWAWALSVLATILVLYTFLLDTDATLRFQAPKPYRYEWFFAGCALYLAAMYHSFKDLFRKKGAV